MAEIYKWQIESNTPYQILCQCQQQWCVDPMQHYIWSESPLILQQWRLAHLLLNLNEDCGVLEIQVQFQPQTVMLILEDSANPQIH